MENMKTLRKISLALYSEDVVQYVFDVTTLGNGVRLATLNPPSFGLDLPARERGLNKQSKG